MSRSKFFKRKCEYLLITGIERFARALPRRLGHRFFGRLGWLGGRIARADRRRAVDNLGIAFPTAPRRVRESMADAMFINLGRNVYDFLNLGGTDTAEGLSWIGSVEGVENLEMAHGMGRGVIAVTGHIGCWEILSAYLGARGYRVTVVGRRMKDAGLDERLKAIRASMGVATLDRDSSPRAMLEVLHGGGILGVLIDQKTRVSGVHVPFFGRPAHTPTGVAKISRLTGSPVVLMADYLEHDGRHRIRVLPAIFPRNDAVDRETAVLELTRQYSQALEDMIRLDPKQWIWFHDRWGGSGETRAETPGRISTGDAPGLASGDGDGCAARRESASNVSEGGRFANP